MFLTFFNRFILTTPDLQQQRQPASTSQPLTFTGSTTIEGTKEERMESIFGGRIRGDARVSSSRQIVNKGRVIAGVDVPAKPLEPDNCCMSGCVNCVWEQYNDDIRDWRKSRNRAIEAISATEDKWPSDFDPPLKKLEIKNVPRELRAMKRKLSKEQKISTASYFPAHGKPGAQNILKPEHVEAHIKKLEKKEEEDEDWANVPVSMRVFAKTEAMMRKRKLARELAAKETAQ